MRSRRLQLRIAGLASAVAVSAPALAFAEEAAQEAATDWRAMVGKATGAAFAMGVSAWSAGYAQSKIGAAGAGTLAERPEAATNIIVLQALPEVIALLGFAIAFLIINAN